MSNEMPQELKFKAVELARKTERPKTARRPLMVFGMAAVAASLAIGAFFFVPRPAMAKSWSLVRQAVNRITSFQMIVKMIDSPNEKPVHIAASGAKLMIDTGEEERVYIDGETIQVYDSSENTVTRVKLDGFNLGQMLNDISGTIADHISLKQIIGDFEKEYGKSNIDISPLRYENGRQVYDVEMRDPKSRGHAFLTVDAQTDLPILIRATGSEKKDDNVEIVLRYNDNVEIHPNFPEGAKFQDIDLGVLKGLGEGAQKIGNEIEKSLKGLGDKK